MVIGGTLVAAAVIVGQLVADKTIVLLGIELDLVADWDVTRGWLERQRGRPQ